MQKTYNGQKRLAGAPVDVEPTVHPEGEGASDAIAGLNVRSEEINDLLSTAPHWLVQWGISLFFLIFLLMGLAAWFIQYPELLRGDILISTEIPPVKVVNQAGGRLVNLLAADTARVSKGAVLAELESTTRLENVPELKRLLKEVRAVLRGEEVPVAFIGDTTLGVLQDDYNALVLNFRDYIYLKTDVYYTQRINALQQQVADYQEMKSVQMQQVSLSNWELKNVQRKYQVQEKLYQEKVISDLEFREAENDFIRKRKEHETLNQTLIENKIIQSERKKQVAELQYEYLTKSRLARENVEKNVRNIENVLDNWQKTYLITAPIAGKLVYLKNLAGGQYIKPADTLFAVVPDGQATVGLLTISSKGMGKVKTGQDVIIKLDDYPYQEYGVLRGKVDRVSATPNVRQYRIRVRLPDRHLTSGGNRSNPVLLKPEMAGTGEVITEHIRFIERAFYGFKGLFEQN